MGYSANDSIAGKVLVVDSNEIHGDRYVGILKEKGFDADYSVPSFASKMVDRGISGGNPYLTILLSSDVVLRVMEELRAPKPDGLGSSYRNSPIVIIMENGNAALFNELYDTRSYQRFLFPNPSPQSLVRYVEDAVKVGRSIYSH